MIVLVLLNQVSYLPSIKDSFQSPHKHKCPLFLAIIIPMLFSFLAYP